jgi:septum formation protein
MQRNEPRLILASASASRRAMLEAAGLRFEVRPAHVDEDALKSSARAEGLPPSEAALLVAELKAQRVASREPQALVIGADQLLVCEGRWFDKPASVAEAGEQLHALRGKSHTLVTSVLCHRGEARLWHYVAEARLTMRSFSDAFLEAYLLDEAEAVTHSVGAYRLEGLGAQLFDRVDGDHFTVRGLPLLPLLGFLRQHGVLGA